MAYKTPGNLSKGLSGAEYLSSGGIFKRRTRHEAKIRLSGQSYNSSTLSGSGNNKTRRLSDKVQEYGKRKDTYLEGSGKRWESD